MDQLTTIQKVIVYLIPILFGVTLHEAAHGYVAYKLGDDTAKRLGRITANPFKHIDPMGTVVIPLILIISSPFVFGWAKPVPVNEQRLRNPRRDMALVACAGPASNFLMAVFWALMLKLSFVLIAHHNSIGVPLGLMGQAGIMINLSLFVLNLIPIPPLDGSRVISALLPRPLDKWFEKITPFGFFIVFLLILSGLLSKILIPGVLWFQQWLVVLLRLHP